MRATSNENRLQGRSFEDRILVEGKLCGLYVRKNPISARYGWKGRLVPIPSQLDFTLVSRKGRVGFFDAKSYKGDHFTFSDIDAKQLEQAILFNELQVPSGFIVNFRKGNDVVFYTGTEISEVGPGGKFTSLDGLRLGNLFDFDLRPVLRPHSGIGPLPCGNRKQNQKKDQNDQRVNFGHSLF